jgi:hypothetical protein
VFHAFNTAAKGHTQGLGFVFGKVAEKRLEPPGVLQHFLAVPGGDLF